MPTKHLYGATLFGIQKFIFETGKLKEIAGASEFVEQFCHTLFRNQVKDYKPENLLLGAAGKIKYIFESKEDCAALVYNFPKAIKELIPDLEFCQAVVELEEGHLTKKALDKLEDRLIAQRQIGGAQHGLGLMISERSPRTGKPATKRINEGENRVPVDRTQVEKLTFTGEAHNSLTKKFFGDGERPFPLDINKIVPDNESGWIAVVHADGNNLGKTVQKIFNSAGDDNLQKVQKVFSERLDQATQKAAEDAFKEIFQQDERLQELEYLPLRPIILGGDDLTLIIRGDLAFDFTSSYLKNFQKYTAQNFSELVKEYGVSDLKGGLSACAGIAFIKPSYPFHYGVDLAEVLTKFAKNTAKNINPDFVPSALAFHKVQSSFVEEFHEIIKRELTVGMPPDTTRFDFGPYFVEEQKGFATIDQLRYWVREIQRKDAPASSLRNWLSTLHSDAGAAEQQLTRIKNLNKRYIHRLGLDQPFLHRETEGERYTHIFDVLTLASIQK